jgi:hypothetical protein
MKKLLASTVIFTVLIHFTYAQTRCTGNPGQITLSVSNLAASPSQVTLTSNHVGYTGNSWQGWNDQYAFRQSGSASFTNCASKVTGLTPGIRYDFKVTGTRFCGRDGQENQNQVVTNFANSVLLRPAKPTVLPATNIGVNSFTANWSTIGGFETFYVDVSSDALFNVLVISNLNTGSNLSVNITNLPTNTTYYYRVRAYNIAGTSPNSSSSSSVTLDNIPPAIPTGLSVSPVDNTINTLTWNANTESDLAFYKIYLSIENEPLTLLALLQAVANIPQAYIHVGVAPGLTKNYSISAVDASGNESAQSPIVNTNFSPSEAIKNELYQIKMFPNPSNGWLNIVLPSTEDAYITLKDLNGVLVMEGHYSQTEIMIELKDINKGTYIIEVLQGKNNQTRRVYFE